MIATVLELIADRLILVDEGTAREFDGTIDDYTRLVLARDSGGTKGPVKANRKEERRLAAAAREQGQTLRSRARAAEAELARLAAERTAIDRAMFDPGAEPKLAKLTMTELMKPRAELAARIEEAEAQCLQASEALEQLAA